MVSLKPRLLALPVLAAAVAGPPAAAQARVPIRVGISDQQAAMFAQPAFQRLHVKHVRYFIAWNAMDDRRERLAARAYVEAARASGAQVLLHLSTEDFRSKKAKLPSVAAYRHQARRLVPYFRKLGVRDFGTWNEANHASQPTYRSPTRAAAYFREMYGAVKGRCRSCGVVALDVLDQRGVESYMGRFYRALSRTYRRRATIVGLHNYGDVNRERTKYTRAMLRASRTYSRHTTFWLTETGGLVSFGRSFPYSQSRAERRLHTMFSLANRYRRSGIARIYVYNWTGAPKGARFDAGLTDPDGTPRPGYTYLRHKLGSYER